MFRLAASRVLLQSAIERSHEWHSQRDNEYHKAMFPIDSEQEMIFDEIDLDELKSDKRNGIYFIFDNTRNIGYVGMASSITFGERFYNGKEDCKDNCLSNCGCFGHINSTPDTCRSSRVITPDAEYRVYCLAEMDAATAEVMQSEVDWYYILLEAGIGMTNAVWALGRAGYTGRPIVSCHLESATYHHFLTTLEAGNRLLSGRAGVNASSALAPVLTGHQNQNYGYTHRYATVEEIDLFRGDTEISELIRDYSPNVSWIDQDGEASARGSRNLRMNWISGPLGELDLAQLKKHSRGQYSKPPKSDYKWVYWMKPKEKWYWKAYRREFRGSGKKRKENVSRNFFSDDRDAAIVREKWIMENKLTDINNSNFDWDPPNMVEEDAADVWWKPTWKIVRLRFIFDLLLLSIVAVIAITIGL